MLSFTKWACPLPSMHCPRRRRMTTTMHYWCPKYSILLHDVINNAGGFYCSRVLDGGMFSVTSPVMKESTVVVLSVEYNYNMSTVNFRFWLILYSNSLSASTEEFVVIPSTSKYSEMPSKTAKVPPLSPIRQMHLESLLWLILRCCEYLDIC